MELQFLLDFDGVLFNSNYEAYTVAQKAAEGRPGFRQDVSFNEFETFRSVVTDAWHYNRLYNIARGTILPSMLREIEPEEDDWAFASAFFAAREEITKDPDWPKVMPPYDFFFLIRPLLIAYPHRFAILSTRNVASIRQALAFHDADVIRVFGQEDIRRAGSKLAVAQEQNWLERGRWLIVYVDDMNSHLEPFEGMVHLPLHANWGYDHSDLSSLSHHQIFTIISSLLTLTEKQN
ncbi:hypothetical protein [Allosphingosinicella deserti]|nr:hypothetical protein [Sphingomonas deserti]